MVVERLFEILGRWLARYLNKPSRRYVPLTTFDPRQLAKTLEPGDVLLVEGHWRFSTAIKYMTQSTWSHAALYVGDAVSHECDEPDPRCLVEADVEHGVRAVPLSKYAEFHTRICRPVGLTAEDRQRVIQYAVNRLGDAYDLKNVIDLARYLFPIPPVPSGWRRRMIALGSGEPTKAICSTLIAQAFQSVQYPILPLLKRTSGPTKIAAAAQGSVGEILSIRHHSLFAPRDFDISPYFEVVKPTIEAGFDYKALVWDDEHPNERPE